MHFILSLFYYFYFSVVGIYVIFIPKVLLGYGYSGVEIGVILGAAPLVRFLLPLLFMRGFALNTQVFLLALALQLLGATAFVALIDSFWPLFLSNIILGVGLSLVLPYIEVIALDVIGKERYGKVRLFGSVGFIIIALVVARWLDNPHDPLYLLVGMVILSVATAYTAQRLDSKHTSSQEKLNTDHPINPLKHWQLWAGFTMMQVSFGSFYNFFTIYATHHGHSLDTTVYMWSFGVFVEVAMLFWQGRLLTRMPLLDLVILSVFVTIFRWFFVYAYPQSATVLFISQSLHALSFALFHSASISYLHQIYRNKRLAQQLFMGFSYGLGGLGGALVSGYIFEYYAKYLFLSSSAFALISFALLLWFKNRQRG